tara:strand:+ start:1541 stop:2182 length:642 start_codon:yes stop_codon:yes gene_type:complete
MKPFMLINFKTYKKGSGKSSLEVAKACQKVNGKVNMAIAVQAADIYKISKSVNIPVYAQHIDDIEYGSHTGWLLPEDIKEAGAAGTLLNHSEHRIPHKTIKKLVDRARKLKLKVIICAKNVSEGATLAKFKPDYIAVEPPELIGSKTKSVCTSKPGLIATCVKKIKAPLLVGAGVKSSQDVKVGMQLGAKGVLLASDVMKAKNPLKELKELVQ